MGIHAAEGGRGGSGVGPCLGDGVVVHHPAGLPAEGFDGRALWRIFDLAHVAPSRFGVRFKHPDREPHEHRRRHKRRRNERGDAPPLPAPRDPKRGEHERQREEGVDVKNGHRRVEQKLAREGEPPAFSAQPARAP